MVYGWFPSRFRNWHTESLDWKSLTHICFRSVEINADGTLKTPAGNPPRAFVETAHRHGVKVTVLAWVTSSQNSDGYLANAPEATARNLLEYVRENDLDGLNIDDEQIQAFNSVAGKPNRDLVTRFLRILQATLEEANGAYQLTFAAPPVISEADRFAVTWLDLAQIAQHVDGIIPDGSRIEIALAPEVTRERAPPSPAPPAAASAPPVQNGFEAITLRYADAEAVASMLSRLVPYGDRLIQVDQRLNRLIFDTSMERFAAALRLVEDLDRPGDQILIDAQIVEINADAASQLGLDRSAAISTRLQEESDFFGTVPLWPIQPIVRTPLEVMATLNLLKGEGKARVLANPRVATIDGVPAVVRTEERFPVFVTQTNGNQTLQVKQDIVAGISLSITPRHNGDGEITTAIKTEVSSITGKTSEGHPTTSSREAETTIRVRSGETIVIGGLLEQRRLQREDRIPLLGEIPFLGRLFTSVRTESKETELFIIVTPHLIDAQ